MSYNGGPAFPQATMVNHNSSTIECVHSNPVCCACSGMSLRDWFAGQTLAMYLSCNEAQQQLAEAVEEKMAADEDGPATRRAATRRILARRAYLQADAMLAERDKNKGGT